MLYTNLKHIENPSDHQQVVNADTNVMICYGRMDFNCISVYKIMEEMQKTNRNVVYYDMEFDNPESKKIPETQNCFELANLPFVFYYQNGKLLQMTSGLQTKEQMIAKLDELFGMPDKMSQ